MHGTECDNSAICLMHGVLATLLLPIVHHKPVGRAVRNCHRSRTL